MRNAEEEAAGEGGGGLLEGGQAGVRGVTHLERDKLEPQDEQRGRAMAANIETFKAPKASSLKALQVLY
jgi:hypothetical protein